MEHIDIFENLNNGTPSVFHKSEMLFGLDKTP